MDDLQGPAAFAPTLLHESSTVEFLGKRGALFGLVLKNMLLTLLTVGIYRFWAKTRLRRYFWGNVVIAGEPLEYTGKATELLIGFLIVIAVLIPLSAASSASRVLAEGGPQWLGPAFDGAYFLILFSLFDFATYRVWRYRLTRTRWRGIRFGMENGALRYTGRAFLWRVGQILSLGFITPWMHFDLARFRIDHMRLGDRPFAMDGPVRPLVLRWSGVWGIPLVILLGTLAFGYSRSFVALVHGKPVIGGSLGIFYAAIGTAVLAGFILFILYRVFEARYVVGCTTVGRVRLESALRARSIVPAYVLAWALLLVLFAAVMGAIFFPAIGLAVKVGVTGATAPVVGAVLGVAVAGAMLVLSPVIIYPIAVFQLIRHVWTTLSIHDIGTLDDVTQAPQAEPRFGEGLADALDVGAI